MSKYLTLTVAKRVQTLLQRLNKHHLTTFIPLSYKEKNTNNRFHYVFSLTHHKGNIFQTLFTQTIAVGSFMFTTF